MTGGLLRTRTYCNAVMTFKLTRRYVAWIFADDTICYFLVYDEATLTESGSSVVLAAGYSRYRRFRLGHAVERRILLSIDLNL